MKSYYVFLMFVFFSFTLITSSALDCTAQSTNSNADITGGGFFINTGPVFPLTNYGSYTSFDDIPDDSKTIIGWNIELGNMFRFVQLNKNSLGLKVSWLSFSYINQLYKTLDEKSDNFQIDFLKLGPFFTVGLTKQMALDAYYQLTPTGIAFPEGDNVFLGLNHNIGLTYRYKIFSAGLDVNLGTMTDDITNDPDDTNPWHKIHTDYLRFNVGFRF
jgi:hypothetical protein